MLIPIAEYRPDSADLGTPFSDDVRNVLPADDPIGQCRLSRRSIIPMQIYPNRTNLSRWICC